MARKTRTWKEDMARFGDMTPTEVADYLDNPIGGLAARFRNMEEDHATLRELSILNAYVAMINEPDQGMLSEFINRIEGKVKDVVDTNVRSVIILDRNASPDQLGKPPDQLEGPGDVVDASYEVRETVSSET
jgi:hypothetical protein